MFANYLTANCNIRDLGYFERINESAAQYAERLLSGKQFPKGKTAQSLSIHFTNHYKDHRFVIDSDEAAGLLGKEIIKEGTKEYQFGNEIYMFLDFANFLFNMFKNKNLRWVGSIDDGFDTNEKKKEND